MRFIYILYIIINNNFIYLFQLSVLKYDEENNQIDAKTIYSHPEQIWAIEPSPKERSLVVTASQRRDGTRDVSLYKLSDETEEYELNVDESKHHSYGSDAKELERLSTFSFQDGGNFVQNIKWHSSRDSILTLDSLNLSVWSLRESSVSVNIHYLFIYFLF